MKELTVISGKGGTGKTSIVAAFTTLAEDAVFCDCDVDAANLHLLLEPKTVKVTEFYGMKKASIDKEKCIQCGRCADMCSFGAITGSTVNELACEGCRLCYHICPVEAVEMVDHLAGHWFVSETSRGPFVHAKLGIAEGNSGLLVAEVRKEARRIAEEKGRSLIITDGPPGIGCPVISSLADTSMALIVTEPTASGIHDLERIVQVAKNFDCYIAVCINKYNLNEENSRYIEGISRKLKVPVVGRISYDTTMHRAVVNKKPVTLVPEGKVQQEIKDLWAEVYNIIKTIK
ncbi:MinD superfamily P-loop ATPase [Desulfohalotomaculum tongense]|uniref:ATP-binding protein n=1 Tax=Desulforadius tongensis TaxID=1216062 RepID=UPI00195815CB|nr:ATP-binding protein [Desulforadius tongensis]MBM7853960.1 MinD superfamily P-loop ATPase [Desulforadius tongensis]